MRSLNAHLRDAETHDRLVFHPSCPICRQVRLSGALRASGAWSPRAQAVMAAGVLAATCTSPAGVLAAEPDQQHEGTAPVEQADPADSAANRDFDPGGALTDLPESAAPVTPDVDDATAAPLPATETDDPIVDPGDAATAAGQPSATRGDAQGQPASAPIAAANAPSAPRDMPSPSSATASASNREATTATWPSTAPSLVTSAGDHDTMDDRREAWAPRGSSGRTAAVTAARTAADPAPPASDPAPTSVASDVARDGPRARPGDQSHTVLRGECLWSIAADVLGPDATTAQVAREVHRLWTRNRDRIGTGDPDLVLAGTTIVLR